MSYKNKVNKFYVKMMSSLLGTKNPRVVKKELKKTGSKIKLGEVDSILNGNFEVESNKVEHYSCRMRDIFQ